MAVSPKANTGYELDRGYRLRRGESVPDGIRRIAGGQLDDAHEALDGTAKLEFSKAVHDTRKSLKRLRACVRLSRDAIGPQTYSRENTVFRMAGQQLSAVRDAQVLIDTLDELETRFAEELSPVLCSGLRERLEHDREREVDVLRDNERTIAAVLGELQAARARTPGWAFEAAGFDALAPGAGRVYRRGRKRVRQARKDPSAENLHDLRKRVKDLWHASQILRPVAPKQMKKLSKRSHRLADLLGDDHDLAVLRDYVELHPQAFDNEAASLALLAVIKRRRDGLQRKALKLAKRIYSQSPEDFLRALERAWRRRMPPSPRTA